MSLLLSALAGAGDAGVQSMNQNIVQQNALDLNQQQSDLTLAKQKALEDYAITLQNQQRAAMVARVGDAKQSLIQQALGQKYGDSDAAVADAANGNTDAPLSDDQLAAIAQAKGIDVSKLQSDPHLAMQAAINTGDISPEKAAAMGQSVEINQLKVEGMNARWEDRNANLLAIGQLRQESFDARTAAQKEIADAKLAAAVANSGNGNTDFDKKISLLRASGSTDKEIANFITDRKQPSIEDLANGFLKSDPNAGMKGAMTPEAAYTKAQTLRSLTSGITPPSTSSSSADKYVVGKQYQDANGNKATYAGNGKWN